MWPGIPVSLLIGYLLGSIPFSYLAGRLRGVDLREHGSGNLGASNTYRVLGAGFAVPVLILDIGKGAAGVIVAGWLAGALGWEPASWCRSAAALGTIAGHIWTVFLKFRGGKGVATAAGAFLGLTPIPALISFVVWLLLVVLTRYVSVGSMIGTLVLPIGVYFVGARPPSVAAASRPEFWLAVIIAVVVLAKHRSNIRRLLDGNENRLERIRKGATS
ncbi:MAG: glycerol-3-phosphate 1-O-acyltransferase PlsY [Candidatus Eisenbacteria sp.]|nr:glycerol-3-phosphate 1-O-acyltransferase PlsY [Candidatus Eisenbacteria bacterium]